MRKSINLTLKEIVGSANCTGYDDGQKVYQLIRNGLNEQKLVLLSFDGVERLTSAFLNVSIGQLYGEFTSDYLREHLKIEMINQVDKATLLRVIDTAKKYFQNPKAVKRIQDQMFGDD